jgi:hypothetical protein
VLHPDADLAIRATAIATDVDARQLAASLRREERPLAGVIDAIPASPGRGRLIDQPPMCCARRSKRTCSRTCRQRDN